MDGKHTGDYLANSGKPTASGTVKGTGRYRDSTFEIKKRGHHSGDRSTDSEVKLLENAAKDLEYNPTAKGTLRVHTARKPCSSCKNAIQAFKKDHPSIDVVVTHGQ
ncbi:MAG: hypothetical protein IPL40_00600 [Proteobacteria bacterium]|nr:hypothetical protein [Pseudomonadota bacterium]